MYGCAQVMPSVTRRMCHQPVDDGRHDASGFGGVTGGAGFAASVADATPEARAAAHWISSRNGGQGAVRELAEFVLRAQDKFDALLARESGAPAGA